MNCHELFWKLTGDWGQEKTFWLVPHSARCDWLMRPRPSINQIQTLKCDPYNFSEHALSSSWKRRGTSIVRFSFQVILFNSVKLLLFAIQSVRKQTWKTQNSLFRAKDIELQAEICSIEQPDILLYFLRSLLVSGQRSRCLPRRSRRKLQNTTSWEKPLEAVSRFIVESYNLYLAWVDLSFSLLAINI